MNELSISELKIKITKIYDHIFEAFDETSSEEDVAEHLALATALENELESRYSEIDRSL